VIGKRRAFLFLVNDRAGAGGARAMDAARRAQEVCRASGCRAERAACATVGDARDRVRRLAPDTIPVAVGGDGTANLLVRALRDEGCGSRVAGLLPAGTGNALAHSLGLGKMDVAVAALVAGEARELDILTTTHPEAPVVLVSLSAGFEARFLRHLAAGRRSSRLWSAGVGLALFFGRTTRGVRLVADGEEMLAPEARFYSAGIYNMPCYAFGREAIPDADPSDGLAHAIVHESRGPYWRALGVAAGGRNSASMRRRAFRRARMETTGPVQVDGESVGPGAFEVSVEAAAIRILVPAGPGYMRDA